MRILHLMATTYHKRPSEILGIADVWAAYQFDAAVLLLGLDADKPGKAASPSPGKDWQALARL
jgi:hypothetical protein